MPTRTARIALRTVGVAIVLCAGFGLLYNGFTLFVVASGALDTTPLPEPVPYMYEAFYTRSTLCVASYIALVISGVQFIRLEPPKRKRCSRARRCASNEVCNRRAPYGRLVMCSLFAAERLDLAVNTDARWRRFARAVVGGYLRSLGTNIHI